MFVHTVFFWLKDDLSGSDRAAFVRGLDDLLSIETIDRAYKGVPADTDRPVIERSYTYGITVVFRDRTAHDAYQAHPKHDVFRDECAKYWKEVRIYDVIEA